MSDLLTTLITAGTGLVTGSLGTWAGIRTSRRAELSDRQQAEQINQQREDARASAAEEYRADAYRQAEAAYRSVTEYLNATVAQLRSEVDAERARSDRLERVLEEERRTNRRLERALERAGIPIPAAED